MNIIHIMLVVCCSAAQKITQTTRSERSNIMATTGSVTSLVTTTMVSLEEDTIDLNITTETALTTICEGNASCFISTADPNSNSSLTELNVTKEITRKKYHKIDATTSSKEFCTCNLQDNICDVNCCCDPDCSLENKLVFHHCESEDFYYDARYCDYMKYIYINNTPLEWHVNQNGLFCILKSNLPPSYSVQRKRPLVSFEAAEQEKVDKFSWPQTFKKKEDKFNASEEFIYGNNIWIVEKNIIKKFQVPKKYFSNTCIMEEDVLNLKNMENMCAQIDITEENKYLSFRNYYQNITVVANPMLLNISKYKNMQECPRNICIAILPKVCDINFNNCQNISRNDSRLDLKCNFDIRNNKNNCKNVVKALQYNFYHNGTKGYIRVELLGVLHEVSYEFGEYDFEFFQEFKVNFWWTNQTRNFSAALSGNPGYLVGKPILSAYLINVGNVTNRKLKIDRSSNVYLENFLTLPENVNGHCALSNTNYIPIEFSYNLLTKCKFSTTVFNSKKYHNGTEMCREMQKTVLNMWGITNKNKTVGMFGNANANIPEEWTNIVYSLRLEKLLNKTYGRFSSGNTSLTCFALVNNIIVDIYHSRIDFKTLLNQEKILGVAYSFAGFINKTLSYSKQTNSTQVELDLESRVVFHDISVQKQKKFVDSPSLEIRLPYDFFYPFIKMENGAEVSSANFIFHIIGYLFILLGQ